MQEYYADKYAKLAKRFFEKFGKDGERARNKSDKSIWNDFIRERNKLFQAGKYSILMQMIENSDISLARNRVQMEKVTDEYQDQMKETIENIQAMHDSI